MRALRYIMLALAFITLPAHARDDRNLSVNQVNTAVSEKRIALVIGNSTYTNSPLKNPVNDAKDMANKLRKLGFEVIERKNLQTKQIGGTLREFRSKLVPGSVALVFYAGHGLQIKGDNYLPAVDAEINSEEDVPNQSLAVKQIMDVLDEAKTRLNLVFLDACRNNPYARSFRSADQGLARITAPSGTLISYATRPGSVAADGNGRNGLYTSKLLAHMDSNQQIEQSLKLVVTEVKTASQGKQEPWMEGSIEGDFCFAGCQVGSLEPVGSPNHVHVKNDEEIEQETWESARDSNDIDAIDEYLKQYPKGKYVALANISYKKLKKDAPETAVQAHNTGQVFKDCPDCPEMVIIPAGSFQMGSYKNDREKPLHRVTFGKAFAIGKVEVTQGQWKSIMGGNPSHFRNCGDNCPIEHVSWNDAQDFIQRLNSKTGKQYRLPSEAEWEYACRAGEQQEFCGSNNIDSVAWYGSYGDQGSLGGNSGQTTHPVATKQANAWGLYDMTGNVWEWVEDSWHDNYNDAPTDGSAWAGDGKSRMYRGGSWLGGMWLARASNRFGDIPEFNDPNFNTGFRLAMTLSTVIVQSVTNNTTQQAELPKGYVSQGGLTWMPINSPTQTWSDANAYCNNTAINGKTGWRLPTKDELSALYASGAMISQGWTLNYTWSSTPYSTGIHYHIFLLSGVLFWGYDTNQGYVTCVR
jgi:formylglycine-generating enzyme required for sulfatase activity